MTDYIDIDDLDKDLQKATGDFLNFTKRAFYTQEVIRFKTERRDMRLAIYQKHVSDYFFGSFKEYIFARGAIDHIKEREDALLLVLKSFQNETRFTEALLSFPTWQQKIEREILAVDAKTSRQLEHMEKDAPSFWPTGNYKKQERIKEQGEVEKQNLTIPLRSSDTLYFAIHLWREVREDADEILKNTRPPRHAAPKSMV